MLGLLSRLVVGEHIEEDSDSAGSSAPFPDTEEEVFTADMPPLINIDPAEPEHHAPARHPPPSCISPTSDSSEDLPAEKDLPPLQLPEAEVCRRVQELVEYYLSAHNLVKDMFMLKHVTKHREGYVSLKLLATYKKVKQLTKDWRVVAHALQHSQDLQLNPEATKVRRRHALPQELDEDTRPFRTLLAVEVSRPLATMNALAEFFGKFGEMVSLQMHKPGGRVLAEVRQAERDHPGVGGSVCALVEYEKVHHARQAFRAVHSAPEAGLRVVEVSRKKRDCGGSGSLFHIKAQTEGESAYYSTSDFSEPPSPVSRVRVFPRIRSPYSPSPSPKLGRHARTGQQQQQSSPESSPPSPYSPRRIFGHGSPSSSPEERPRDLYPRVLSPLPRRRPPPSCPSPAVSPFLGRRQVIPATQDGDQVAGTPPLSPWLRRRVLSGCSTPLASPLASPNLRRRHEASLLLADNVTRLPRGPDGSKGFAARRTTTAMHA